MKQLINIDDLQYSGKLFLEDHSKFESKIIFIILSILVCFLFWIFIGQKQEVVHGVGVVRTSKNVSDVVTTKSGVVDKIFFKDGEFVKKGYTLLLLRNNVDIANKKAIQVKLNVLEQKEKDLELVLNSFYANRNIIPKSRKVAYFKMKNFLAIKYSLAEIYHMHKRALESEKSLPFEVQINEKILTLENNFKNAQLSLSEYSNKFLTELLTEQEKNHLERKTLEAMLEDITESLNLSTIVSPIDGRILSSSSLNENDYVFANKSILKIIPTSEPGYNVYVTLSSRQAGLIECGMKVNLKFPSFPRYEFDKIQGEITNISPDSISNGKELFYIATVKLENTKICSKDGNEVQLRPGLQAEARIVMNEESIFTYILKKLEVFV